MLGTRLPTWILSFSLVSLSLTSATWADVNRWTALGPSQERVCFLAADPFTSGNSLAATATGGAFRRSGDDPAWKPVLPTTGIRSLTFDPTRPGVAYAGDDDGNVWTSKDGGRHWSSKSIGYIMIDISAVVADPSDPQILYAGAFLNVDSLQRGGVFKSTDGGATWILTTYRHPIRDLVMDPQNPAVLYAATQIRGVFKTVDAGGHWTKINDGLPELPDLDVRDLLIDPANPQVVYAVMAGGGVFKTVDAGAHWSSASAGLGDAVVRELAVDPTTATTLFAGTAAGDVFQTTNGGATWNVVSRPASRDACALALEPMNPNHLLVGTLGDGLFESNDGGATWTDGSLGLTDAEILSLVIDPEDPATLYAGSRDGVFKSEDGGGRWDAAAKGLPGQTIRDLAFAPSDPDTLYAGTSGPVHGVYRSLDGGVTWIPVGPADEVALSLAIDPLDPARLYAMTPTKLFKTSDGGETWSEVLTTVTFFSLAIDPQTPTTVYAGTRKGIFKTTDGGETWILLGAGFEGFSSSDAAVQALAIDPVTPSTLYAGVVGDGVYKSMDAGLNWSLIASEPLFPKTLVVDPATPATLYAGGTSVEYYGGGITAAVVKSTDGGVTWTRLETGLAHTNVLDLVIDPSAPERLYAATSGGGVYSLTQDPDQLRLTQLSLQGARFTVDVSWRDFRGKTGKGKVVSLAAGPTQSRDSGLFYFFSPDNWELLVKVLNGCGSNGHFWVFSAATTNVEYTLRVQDIFTGTTREYKNPLGTAAPAVTDTNAFDGCP